QTESYKKKRRFPQSGYETLHLVKIQSLSKETAEKLFRLQGSGARIISQRTWRGLFDQVGVIYTNNFHMEMFETQFSLFFCIIFWQASARSRHDRAKTFGKFAQMPVDSSGLL
ncbi:hypothetical protein, partial [Undibacterium sp.]|uniref:hypothetical protein n=1 Tax=Undibacterium sp. TaxID=1914977 RepID=UPI00374D8CA0